MNSKLTEGLRVGDLKDLILPLLSIDEYESKVSSDDDIIVIGFFVEDEDPAKDLSRFIDKSVRDIIDTEVSPAPTPENYFVVFVEIERNEKFFTTLYQILEEIQALVDIQLEKWTFKSYKHDVQELTKETLKDSVRIHEKTFEQFEARKFLNDSTVDSINFKDDFIIIEHKGKKHYFKLIEHTSNNITENYQISLESTSKCHNLDFLLGDQYSVALTQSDNYVITKANNDKRLIVRKV